MEKGLQVQFVSCTPLPPADYDNANGKRVGINETRRRETGPPNFSEHFDIHDSYTTGKSRALEHIIVEKRGWEHVYSTS